MPVSDRVMGELPSCELNLRIILRGKKEYKIYLSMYKYIIHVISLYF